MVPLRMVSVLVLVSLAVSSAWAADAAPQTPVEGAATAPAASAPAPVPLPPLANTTVSIPWPELKDLLLRAQPAGPEHPPVTYVFAPAAYTVTVEERRAAVRVACEVTTLVDGWVLVPLGPASAGVTEATVGGQPCPLVVQDQQLLALLSGKGKRQMELTLERPVTLNAEGGSMNLPLVPAALATLTATFPQAPLDVSVPGVAVRTAAKDGKTVLTCSLRGGGSVGISWQVRKPQAPEQAPRLYADTAYGVIVEPHSVRVKAIVRYEILRGSAGELRVALPEDAELLRTTGDGIRQSETIQEGGKPVLRVVLADPVKGEYTLTLVYEKRLKEAGGNVAVPLLACPGTVQDKGSVGLEVRGGMEVTPAAEGAERIDVKELPASLWTEAETPMVLGFRYAAPGAKITLALTKHKDVDVLVAVSDVCEATTTVTPDGKVVTKMMYICRNNLKQFMTLSMPEGADVWSAFVDDRPVTPVRNAKGEILIPLKKSEEVDEEDEEAGKTYRAQREKRRREPVSGGPHQVEAMRALRAKPPQDLTAEPPKDLKPYDVEIVFVSPRVDLGAKGDVKLALPKNDVPTGQLAWAVFLPPNLKVLDTTGNLKEVATFSLPFRHFGEAEYMRQQQAAHMARAAEQAALAQAQQALQALAQAVQASKAQGVLPVRVEIPMTGEIYKFEKFLVVSDETPAQTLTYRRKAE